MHTYVFFQDFDLGLTRASALHLELIFVHLVWKGSSLMHLAIHLSWWDLLQRVLFAQLTLWNPRWKWLCANVKFSFWIWVYFLFFSPKISSFFLFWISHLGFWLSYLCSWTFLLVFMSFLLVFMNSRSWIDSLVHWSLCTLVEVISQFYKFSFEFFDISSISDNELLGSLEALSFF